MVPDSTIEEIRSRVDLGELVSSYGVNVRHAGSGLMACCPFHNEKTPSFNINTNRGFYHCFGCGESGDAFTFVMKMEGATFMEAVKKLAERVGVKIEETKEDPAAGRRKRLFALMAQLAQFYHRCLDEMREAQLAREYLAKRDLGKEAQEAFLIGYAPAGAKVMFEWARRNGYAPEEMEAAGILKLPDPNRPGDEGYHRFGGRLMFTIRDKNGRVVAFSGRQLVENKRSGKYVNSPVTEIFKKSEILFGFDRAAGNIARSPHREVIVCEGQIDCIRLHISGFPVAVASQGTAFTEDHVKMLSRVADSALLVFDDDAAGHKATIASAGMLLAAGIPVRVVRLPDGDDPDSFLRTKGADAFKKLLENAESIIPFQCRVERAKETNPNSIDALARITSAVLKTISRCPNAVLKAGMIGEASKILGVPALALNEELGKVHVEARKPRPAAPQQQPVEPPPELDPADEEARYAELERQLANEEDAGAQIAGRDAAKVFPPPSLEMEFLEFLLANENDAALAAFVADFMPDAVLSHEFTRKFVRAWRDGPESGADALDNIADSLDGEEMKWFGDIVSSGGRSLSSDLSPAELAKEYARRLWCTWCLRKRGSLDASDDDDEAVIERMRLSSAINRLKTARWPEAERMIADFKSNLQPNTQGA